jgi:tape measure domain-containing protein
MDEFIKFSDWWEPGMQQKLKAEMDGMLASFKAGIDGMVQYAAKQQASMGNTISPQNIKNQGNVSAVIDDAKKKQQQYTEMEKEAIRIAQEHERVMAKLMTASSKESQLTENLRAVKAKLNAEQRNNARLNTSEAGSLDQMSASLRKHIAMYASLSAAKRNTASIGGVLLKTIQQEDVAVKSVNASMGRHQGNVGNYSSALKGLGAQVLNLGMAYISLQGAINVARDIFATTKELNTLAFSYKVLIDDSRELSKTQSFLSDITERFGLNIITTSQAYLKFRASIEGTGFEIDKAQKLFGQLAKAGSVLGLSAQRMDLIFLALEQMISKATVSTEELRRQLGDNLYGAMNIMARSLGVTTAELLKMIKANKVLATEVLPKFGDEVEKTYGIENVNRVETLQSAIGRLQNAWINLVKEINAASLSKGAVDFLASIINLFGRNVEDETLKKFADQLEPIRKKLEDIQDTPMFTKLLVDELQTATDNIVELGLEIAKFKQESGGHVPLVGTPDYKLLRDMSEQYEALKKIRTELERWLKDPTSIRKMVNPEDKKIIEDEELTKLKEALANAKGLIAIKEAEIAINRYLINQARDESTIEKLNKENQILEAQLKKLKNIGIEVERVRDGFIKIDDKSIQGMADKANDAINAKRLKGISDTQADAYNDDLRKRLTFFNKVKKIDGESYQEQMAMLKQFHEDKVITDKEFFWTSIQLWMDNNKATIDAVKQLQDAAFGLANTIYDAKVDQAKRELDIYNKQIDDLQSKLEKEKELKDEGKANDYDRLASQLGDEQKLRTQAQKKYEIYQKRQAQLKFLETQANLGVSVAEAFAANSEQGPAGWIAAIAASAALIAAFIGMQNQIKNIGGQQYGEGGWIEGKSHKEGGVNINAEGDEFVVKKSVAQRYGGLLETLNEGQLPNIYALNFGRVPGNNQIYNSSDELLKEARRQRKVTEQMLDQLKNASAITENQEYITIARGPYNIQRIKK